MMTRPALYHGVAELAPQAPSGYSITHTFKEAA